MGEETIRVEPTDIEFLDTWVNKNVRVISGIHKGVIGTAYLEKSDYVMITKDMYGKNSNKAIVSLTLLKIKKTDIKLFEQQYSQTTEEKINIQYKDLFAFYKNKVLDLYTLVKYNFFQYNNNDDCYKQYNALYDIALKVFNNMRLNDITLKQNLNQMKKDFNTSKKQLLALKKAKKNKEFIKMKKELKKEEIKIKKMIKQFKSLTTVNNKFEIEDNELVNTSEQYNHYIKQEKRQRSKKIRMSKKLAKTVVDKQVARVSDILAGLGL